MANDYATGNILAWSSWNPSTFGGSPGTETITATYIPSLQNVTQALITNTDHDMFCEGLVLDFNGHAIATGGNTASATSIYDSGSNTWTKGPVSQPKTLHDFKQLNSLDHEYCPRLPSNGHRVDW